jgi:DNA-binding HxlR family transcriptional regulator
MEQAFRCDCPITSALDVVGDRWILVIVKLMLLEDKHTFKAFVESNESIATNILSSKLKALEAWGLITKSKLPNNKKVKLYRLTEKGLSLAPLIVELALWSDQHLRALNGQMQDGEGLEQMKNDKAGFVQAVVEGYRRRLEAIERGEEGME